MNFKHGRFIDVEKSEFVWPTVGTHVLIEVSSCDSVRGF